MNRTKMIVVAGLALTLIAPGTLLAQGSLSAQPGASQVPQPPDGSVSWGGVGYGLLTVVADLVYVPAKVVYASLGGLTGGAGYLITGGNSQVSDTIWRSSLGGDYVLTPDMIRGDKPIYFSGPTTTAPAGGGQTSAAPSSSVATAPVAAEANKLPATSTNTMAGTPIDSGSGPVNPPTRVVPSGSDIE